MKYFETEITVRFNEVDQWGIVYYANYFTYVEVARAELLGKVGLLPDILSGIGYTAPIVSLRADFRSPARFNEVLKVRLFLVPQPAAKLVFDFKIFNKKSEKLVMEGESTQVLLNEKGYMVFQLKEDLADKINNLQNYFTD
jgi:acyl-CoA thioester hydrolase